MFAYIFFSFLGTTELGVTLSNVQSSVAGTTQNSVYQLLKELELNKLIPLFALFLMGFVVYLFDRFVGFLGNVVPPFPRWIGSQTPYIDKHVVSEFWSLLPVNRHLSGLDYTAKRIIDEARVSGKTLPDRARTEYLDNQFSKAAGMFNYAKAGVAWVLLLFISALSAGRPVPTCIAWLVSFLLLFLLLGLVGIVRTTKWLLLGTEEDIRIATTVLYAKGNQPARHGTILEGHDFESEWNKYTVQAERLVDISWGSRGEWLMLRNAFFGFRRRKGASRKSALQHGASTK